MEARLAPSPAGQAITSGERTLASAAEAPPVALESQLTSDDLPPDLTESAESEFLAESRARGEPAPVPKQKQPVAGEETDSKSLPPLDDLVKRIPPDVRAMLEELFRAKFLTVRRLPKSVFK